MKIKFTSDQINECSNGRFFAKNDGKPFEVDPAISSEILEMKTVLNGETVPVFEVVAEDDAVEMQAVKAEPETVESLAKKDSREELEETAEDAGLDGDTTQTKKSLRKRS